jgi:HEPN domain-containing protein
MVDMEKQVIHWCGGAHEALESARLLIESGKTHLGLFLVHLAIEKALKALVCRHTNELAPREHNLLKLAKRAGLSLTESQEDILADTNAYNIEGRYPDAAGQLTTRAEAHNAYNRAERMFQWLIAQL